MDNNYIIYTPNSSPKEEEEFTHLLRDNFGILNVCHIGPGAFAVKTPETSHAIIAKKIGFDDENGRVGFLVDATRISGAYNGSLWNFLDGKPPLQTQTIGS